MTDPLALQATIAQYWGYTTFRPLQQEAMEDEESATAESNGHTGASTVDDGSGALRADETR